jgi:hypothetical protein
VNVSLRRTLASAAAAAVVLALAGCGGDDDKAADKAADKSSVQSSSSSSPSAPAETTSSTPTESAGSTDAAASGNEISVEDFAAVLTNALDDATTAHMVMELGGSAGTAEGDADYTKSPPEMAMKMTLASLDGDVEVRLVDGSMFMKSATFGDKWISVPLDDPNSPLGALGDQLDLTKAMERFTAAATSASDLGSEEVDGDTLEHYSATVDTKKLLESQPNLSAGAATLPDTTTQEWWFDEDGLLRKFQFGATGTVVNLSDWGEDVSIEAPPADQVTSMPGGAATS